MKLKIITDPNPILRQPTVAVVDFDMELQTLIDNMVETMRKNQGVGLAAPQINENKRIVILEHDIDQEKDEALYKPFPLTIICNPKIKSKSKDLIKMVEGCLSFPGIFTVIKRPKKVVVEGHDRYGKKIEIDADKFQSRVLQHEIDHLNSTLLSDYMKEMSIVFFGTGDFGLHTLEYLNKDPQYKIKKVFTNKKRSKVRGKNVDNNKIKQFAKKNNLDISETDDINSEEFVAKLKAIKPEVAVVVDFGQIINKEVFSIPKHGTLNVHPSLLPKNRGSSPIQSTILNKDKKAGVSIIQIDEGIDSGPILAQNEFDLKESHNFEVLSDYLSKLGASLLLDILPYHISGEIKPEAQDEKDASYTKLIKKSDGRVDSDSTGAEVHRKVMALSPWPGVYVLVNKKIVKITATHLDEDKKLVIERVKPEGKSEMNYSDYLRGGRKELTFKD